MDKEPLPGFEVDGVYQEPLLDLSEVLTQARALYPEYIVPTDPMDGLGCDSCQ